MNFLKFKSCYFWKLSENIFVILIGLRFLKFCHWMSLYAMNIQTHKSTHKNTIGLDLVYERCNNSNITIEMYFTKVQIELMCCQMIVMSARYK